MTIYPVILCGGSGSRLWPLSREHYPKPLLPLTSGQTLLQETAMRLDGLSAVGDAVCVCNEEHRFLVAEQVSQLGSKLDTIILEPEGRNTAPGRVERGDVLRAYSSLVASSASTCSLPISAAHSVRASASLPAARSSFSVWLVCRSATMASSPTVSFPLNVNASIFT